LLVISTDSYCDARIHEYQIHIKYIKTVNFVRVECPWSAIFLDGTHLKRELYQMNAI